MYLEAPSLETCLLVLQAVARGFRRLTALWEGGAWRRLSCSAAQARRPRAPRRSQCGSRGRASLRGCARTASSALPDPSAQPSHLTGNGVCKTLRSTGVLCVPAVFFGMVLIPGFAVSQRRPAVCTLCYLAFCTTGVNIVETTGVAAFGERYLASEWRRFSALETSLRMRKEGIDRTVC